MGKNEKMLCCICFIVSVEAEDNHFVPVRDADGAFRAPKTSPATASIQVPPTRYAVSLPAHQNKLQKTNGPIARPS